MTRLRIYLALGPVALLAACATDRVPPATITQTVDRPVAVPCLKPGQRPLRPRRLTEDLPVPPATLTEMVGRLRAKLVEWTNYGQTADDLLTICERLPVTKGGDVK